MTHLHLHLLGGITLYQDGSVIINFHSRKAEALLAYLVMEKRSFFRTELATLFWQDSTPKQATHNLRKLLHELRNQIAPWLIFEPHTVAFNTNLAYELDVEHFEAGINDSHITNDTLLTTTIADTLTATLAYYQGPFLAGLHIQGAPRFDEWLSLQRERLMLLAQHRLHALVTYHFAHRHYETAISQTKRLLTLNPLDETAHYTLMRLYLRTNHRDLALKQYQQCQQRLQTELNIAPTAVTQQLYQRVLKANTPIPHQLPNYPPPFVGREPDLAILSQQLDQKRLLTLVGTGGLGKTRLAVQAADVRRGEYRDGITFVPLAHIEQATLLATTIANTLGFSLQGQQSHTDQLLDYLRAKEMLLILDNFEHLVEQGTPFVNQLLTTAPNITLLLTSRERLNLPNEYTYTVHGLSYPHPNESSTSEHTAIQLFQDCAQWSGFPLATEAKTAIIHICQLLDGSPLGIELAAASLATHTPAQIATAIRQNLDFLTNEMWDIPARHRSLRAVFQHSWSLLTPSEQRIWTRLAIFSGTFDAAAALAIAQASQTILQSLLRQSMIRQIEQRYEIHPLLRQYGIELLQQQTQTTAVSHQYSHYYATFLHNRMGQLNGQHQVKAIQTIQSESHNIYAAWTWASKHAQTTILETALPAFTRFLEMTNAYRLGAMLWQHPLATLAQDSPLYGRLLARYGATQSMLGDNKAALAALQQALPHLNNHPLDHAYTLNFLGDTARIQGEYETAEQYHQQALTLAQQVQDTREIASSLSGLALVAIRYSNYTQAEIYLQQSYELCEAIGDDWSRSNRLIMLGVTAYRLGQYPKGQQQLEEAAAIKRQFGAQRGLSAALNNLGLIADVLGDYKRAQTLYQECLIMQQKIGFRWGVAVALQNLSVVSQRLGDYDAVYNYSHQKLAICADLQDKNGEADGLTSLGIIATEQGEFATAMQHHQQALTIRQTIGDHRGQGWSLHHLGKAALGQGQLDQAETYFEQSLQIRHERDDSWGLTFSLCGLSELRLAQGNLTAATQTAQQALTMALDKQTFVAVTYALAILAHIYAQQGDTTAAIHTANLVAHHPATEYVTKTAVLRLLESLNVKRPLPSPTFPPPPSLHTLYQNEKLSNLLQSLT